MQVKISCKKNLVRIDLFIWSETFSLFMRRLISRNIKYATKNDYLP